MINLIEADELDKFEELLKKIKGVDLTKNTTLTPLKRLKPNSSIENSLVALKVDEFLLLAEIVKRERVHFL